MFSIVFPGQGSQKVGMGKDLYDNFQIVKDLFNNADEILGKRISKIILDGPEKDLNLTENTQPAIFLVGYSIYNILVNEFKIKLSDADFIAGHSLGEYTALTCSKGLDFVECLKILKIRGKSMQESVPEGNGGMIAILGAQINEIEKILDENKNNFNCYIANDNTDGQVVVSGFKDDIQKLIVLLKEKKIKNLPLPVSAPFHCKLMKKSTEIMINEIDKINLKMPKNKLISNVTADVVNNIEELKKLLIKQIESRVRWRETINRMIDSKIQKFIEIGPGKSISGMVKRISKNVNIVSINSVDDIKKFKL